MTSVTALIPAAAKSLERWLAMVAKLDFSDLAEILNDTSIFRSPMSDAEWPKATMIVALRTVFSVLKDFQYHRQYVTKDGLNVVLEFGAIFGGTKLKGVDLIRFDNDGLIMEFEVMIRPLEGLQLFGAEMATRLSPKAKSE